MCKPKFYIGRNLDKDVVACSSSGGIVSLVAELFLNKSGVVYGATFDKELLNVHHIRVSSIEELKLIRKSKYVWSDFKTCLPSLEKDLEDGRQVLFIGTPCQSNSIINRFKNYKNLVVLDFFCHGTLQPKYFTGYLNSLNDAIHSVDFRTDSINNHNFVLSIKNEHGVDVVNNEYGKDILTSIFISSAGLRKACLSCKFCNKLHCSSITVGDVEFQELANKYGYDKYHLSFIAVNNESGKNIYSEIKEKMTYAELNFDDDKFIKFYYRERENSKTPWGYHSELQRSFDSDFEEYGLLKAYFNSKHYENKKFLEKIPSYKHKSFFIYGCGSKGSDYLEAIRSYFPNWVVKGFITSQKSFDTKENLKVYGFSEFLELEEKTFIIVGSTGTIKEEIYNILKNKGFKEGVDFL